MFYFDDDFSIESERINISNFGIEFEKRKNNEQRKRKPTPNCYFPLNKYFFTHLL